MCDGTTVYSGRYSRVLMLAPIAVVPEKESRIPILRNVWLYN